MKRSIVSLRSSESTISDSSKFSGQLYQLQESMNQKIKSTAKEMKNLSEITDKLRTEMNEMKKGKNVVKEAKEDNYDDES